MNNYRQEYKLDNVDRFINVLGKDLIIKKPRTQYESLLEDILEERKKRSLSRGIECNWSFTIESLEINRFVVFLYRQEEVIYQKIAFFQNLDEYHIADTLCKLLYFDITTFGISSIDNYNKL